MATYSHTISDAPDVNSFDRTWSTSRIRRTVCATGATATSTGPSFTASTAVGYPRATVENAFANRLPRAIADAAINLLGNDDKRLAMGRRAAAYGRDMLWPAVARSYMGSFQRALGADAQRRRSAFQAQTLARRPLELPTLELRHLRQLTDDTGILQHAIFTIPRYDDGYCLDDNARALLLVTLIEDAGTEDLEAMRLLSSRYLAFVSHAFDARSGRFRNFMSYTRHWTEERGSDDSHGRAMWALGTLVGRSAASGTAQPGRVAVSRRAGGDGDALEPARVGLHAARGSTNICAPSKATPSSKRRARSWPIACSTSIAAPASPTGPGSKRA